jgi:hypothetical protein
MASSLGVGGAREARATVLGPKCSVQSLLPHEIAAVIVLALLIALLAIWLLVWISRNGN